MQNGVKRSELELRGPRNEINIGPPSCRWVGSVPHCTLSPMVARRSDPPRRKGAENTGNTHTHTH
eukprot:12728685-Alexandrium_andersonii.AAC.1